MFHRALSKERCRDTLFRAVLRGDLPVMRQALGRVWEQQSSREWLKWELPFILGSVSFHSIRSLDPNIFNPKMISGALVLDVLSKTTLAGKNRDAWALANVYQLCVKTSFHTDNKEVTEFFNYLRLPKIYSNSDPYIEWTSRVTNMPLSTSSNLLVHAIHYLWAKRRPPLEYRESIVDGIRRRAQIDVPDVHFWALNPYDKEDLAFVSECILNKLKISEEAIKKLWTFLYYEKPNSVFGCHDITDMYIKHEISMQGKSPAYWIAVWGDIKSYIEEKLAERYVDEHAVAGVGTGLDEPSEVRREPDGVREAQDQDAQEELCVIPEQKRTKKSHRVREVRKEVDSEHIQEDQIG